MEDLKMRVGGAVNGVTEKQFSRNNKGQHFK